MTTKTCALLAVLSVGFSLACNNRTDAPPEFNSPMTTSDGTVLVPIRVAKHDKASLTGGAASTETPAAGEKGGGSSTGTAAAVQINDSTAEELANSYIAIMQSGSLSQLAEIVLPEQKDGVQQFANTFQPVTEAVAEFKKALDAKFPGQPIKLPGGVDFANALSQEVTITDIKTTDDTAEGTIHSKTASGEETTQPVKFKRIDGKWKMDAPTLPNVPGPDELPKFTEVLGKASEYLKSLAKRISDGEFADAKAVEQELGKGLVEAIKGGSPSAGTPPPDAKGGEKPANPPPTGRQRPRPQGRAKDGQPDPLDGTVPLPGVLPRG